MQYLGSKNRIAKHILPIMLADRQPGQFWVEPFVGGANMIDKVDGNRIGNDKHFHLIEMWKALQQGWIPPTEVSREFYREVRTDKDKFPPELVAFIGFLCSFGAKWWGGYSFNNKGDNYAERGSRMLLKQLKFLKDVVFTCMDYREMVIEPNSIIYCDPPYKGVTSYNTAIDHEEFYQWCRDKANEGHTVFISEYAMPEDFECVLVIDYKTVLNKNESSKRQEKLFKCSIP